jgi:hypothetical protein
MTEERKHAILFAATILSARKLIECIDSDKPKFAKEYFVDKAINEAAFVLERIERKLAECRERSWTRLLALEEIMSLPVDNKIGKPASAHITIVR